MYRFIWNVFVVTICFGVWIVLDKVCCFVMIVNSIYFIVRSILVFLMFFGNFFNYRRCLRKFYVNVKYFFINFVFIFFIGFVF